MSFVYTKYGMLVNIFDKFRSKSPKTLDNTLL